MILNDNVPVLALSIPDAAKALGMSAPHLWREVGNGNLPSVKCGRRRLVLCEDLLDYLRKRRAKPSQARAP